MAHDAPLRLRTGPDRLLSLVPLVCGATAPLLMLALDIPWDLSLPAGAACLLAGILLTRRSMAGRPGDLELAREGAARWRHGGTAWRHGRWKPRAWINRRYAVVTIRRGRGTWRFIVTRQHQAPGQFRILSAWLRWSRTTED